MRAWRSGEPVSLPFCCSLLEVKLAGDALRMAGAGKEPPSEDRCRLGDRPRFAESGSKLLDVENFGGGGIDLASVVWIGDWSTGVCFSSIADGLDEKSCNVPRLNVLPTPSDCRRKAAKSGF